MCVMYKLKEFKGVKIQWYADKCLTDSKKEKE